MTPSGRLPITNYSTTAVRKRLYCGAQDPQNIGRGQNMDKTSVRTQRDKSVNCFPRPNNHHRRGPSENATKREHFAYFRSCYVVGTVNPLSSAPTFLGQKKHLEIVRENVCDGEKTKKWGLDPPS